MYESMRVGLVEEEQDITDNIMNLTLLLRQYQRIQVLNAEINSLSLSLTSTLSSYSQQQHINQRHTEHTERMEELSSLIQHEGDFLYTQRVAIRQQRAAMLPKLQDMLTKLILMTTIEQQVATEKERLSQRQKFMLQQQELIDMRRRKMMLQLSSIFPIIPLHTRKEKEKEKEKHRRIQHSASSALPASATHISLTTSVSSLPSLHLPSSSSSSTSINASTSSTTDAAAGGNKNRFFSGLARIGRRTLGKKNTSNLTIQAAHVPQTRQEEERSNSARPQKGQQHQHHLSVPSINSTADIASASFSVSITPPASPSFSSSPSTPSVSPSPRAHSGHHTHSNSSSTIPFPSLSLTSHIPPARFYLIHDSVLPPFQQLLSYDEEKVSTALGHIVLCVSLISKYYGYPLRYRLFYRASRSMIYDDCEGVYSTAMYPLYVKHVEHGRFEYGVYFLNQNIETLLNAFIMGWQRYVHINNNTLEKLKILTEGLAGLLL